MSNEPLKEIEEYVINLHQYYYEKTITEGVDMGDPSYVCNTCVVDLCDKILREIGKYR